MARIDETVDDVEDNAIELSNILIEVINNQPKKYSIMSVITALALINYTTLAGSRKG